QHLHPPPSHPAHLLAEAIATLGLVLVIFALARSQSASRAPAAVGAYIGAAYWFTSSSSFANPAITVGRTLSDTFAGIAPASAPGFILAQLAGGALAIAAIRALHPNVTRDQPAAVVLPHAR
ncbi:MAG: aquaporin family protein, partial [Solirubrobacteraceae bacterium]